MVQSGMPLVKMATAEFVAQLRKRLQQAQQTDVTYRLSEQNCVELVRRLVEARKLVVLYTLDGKEYVTPQQLDIEVAQEMKARGGRVELLELQRSLNMDYAYIEASASRLTLQHRNDAEPLTLINGELMSPEYFADVVEEIHEALQEAGQLYVADLCQQFGLSTEFLSQLIDKAVDGGVIGGQRDPVTGTVYTDAYLRRLKAIVRGALNAATRPTSFKTLAQTHALQERLVAGIVDELIAQGEVAGKLSGVRDHAVFVPDIFQRTQAASVSAFFLQNGYIELDTLKRLEVDDAKAIMRKLFPGEGHIALVKSFISPSIVGMADAGIDEALSSVGWVHADDFVPSSLATEDVDQILARCASLNDKVVRFANHYFATTDLVQSCLAALQPVLRTAAESAPPPDSQDDDDDWSLDRKGRKKGAKAALPKSSSGPASSNLPLIKLKEAVHSHIADADDDFVGELVRHLRPKLVQQLDEYIQVFRAPAAVSANTRKKAQEATRDQVDELRLNILLFKKSISYFDDPQTASLLDKHLIKTLGSTVVDVLVLDLARQHNLVPVASATDEDAAKELELVASKRDEFIDQKFPPNDRKAMRIITTALVNAKSADEFVGSLDSVAPQLGLHWKKADKKHDRQVVFKQRQSLVAQLKTSLEPSLILHLAVLVLFQHATKGMLLAPGRLVPAIVAQLAAKNAYPSDQMQALTSMQQLVIRSLSAKGDQAAQVKEQLAQQGEVVRKLALGLVGGSSSDDAAES